MGLLHHGPVLRRRRAATERVRHVLASGSQVHGAGHHNSDGHASRHGIAHDVCFIPPNITSRSNANPPSSAWTIKGRAQFRANGQAAQIGTYAYAFTWTPFVCFLIATVLFCIGGGGDKTQSSSSGGYFGRKRSTRSRGSFRDSESGRRVKDEYD